MDSKTLLAVQDETTNLMMELELVPIARAMVGMDIEEAKQINPIWCLRPESMKAYIQLKTIKDDSSIMTSFSSFVTGDEFMARAVQNIGSDATTEGIAKQMEQGWVKRSETSFITKLLEAKSVKAKQSIINALRSLYHQQSPEVYVVDLSNPSPPEDFLMVYEGIEFRPRGDMSIIKAKKKSGKSTFLRIEIACMISESGQILGLSRSVDPETDEMRKPLKVLWIDTEQSYATTDKSYRQVLQTAGLPYTKNSERLKMVNLRMMASKNRLSTVEDEVVHGDYDVVVLDGVKDVAKNINDPEETDIIVSRILQLIQDTKIAFITVIHENPSKESDKMRGWLGTELGNKCFEVQEVKNNQDSGVFTVINTDRREKTIPPYGFKYNDNDELEQCEPEINKGPGSGPQGPTREEKQWNQFAKVYEDNLDVSLTQEEIVQKMLVFGASETTAKRRVKAYLAKKKIIATESDGATRYGLSMTEKGKLKARLEGDAEAPIIGPNDPKWTQNDELPF